MKKPAKTALEVQRSRTNRVQKRKGVYSGPVPELGLKSMSKSLVSKKKWKTKVPGRKTSVQKRNCREFAGLYK